MNIKYFIIKLCLYAHAHALRPIDPIQWKNKIQQEVRMNEDTEREKNGVRERNLCNIMIVILLRTHEMKL